MTTIFCGCPFAFGGDLVPYVDAGYGADAGGIGMPSILDAWMKKCVVSWIKITGATT